MIADRCRMPSGSGMDRQGTLAGRSLGVYRTARVRSQDAHIRRRCILRIGKGKRSDSPRAPVLGKEVGPMIDQRRVRIEQEMARLGILLDRVAIQFSEGSEWNGDLADKADELMNRSVLRSRYQHLVQKRCDLEHVLRRIDRGLGDICEVCGRPIGAARLEAMIEATCCRDCQQSRERGSHRVGYYVPVGSVT